MEKYALGLDIGTNSVGWALVDENNDIIKKNGKSLWGVRMFQEASDASARRSFRANRRRLNRRTERLNLLREIFFDEINRVDQTFLERLDDSFFQIEDKRNKNTYTLFCDKTFTDKDYRRRYPTIYHLRKDLLEREEQVDIRLIYLALHHMIKYRGNFLYEGDEFKPNNNQFVKDFFELLNSTLKDFQDQNEDDAEYFSIVRYNKDENENETEPFFHELKEILLSAEMKKSKKERLASLFQCGKKTFLSEAVIPLLVNSPVSLEKLTFVKDEKYEKTTLDLSKETYLEDIQAACNTIPELASLIVLFEKLKEVIDYYFLLSILKTGKDEKTCYISDAMIRIYDTHQKDLKELKKLFKEYLPEDYNLCFRKRMEGKDKIISNYVNYIGYNNAGGKIERFKKIGRDEFYAFLKKEFDKITDEQALATIDNIRHRMEDNSYMPKQNSNQNGSLPMQLNLTEMKCILRKQSKYYPFLVKEENGISNADKIISLLKSKIPYYVGPLNRDSKYAWVIKKKEGKVYPWNMKEMIDFDETAKEFIKRMQRKCTYLKGEDDICLPKDSLIYSEYNCLSYLNKLYLNGKPIDVNLKMDVYRDVFLKQKQPTKKSLTEYFKKKLSTSNFELSHTEGKALEEVNCSMKSYVLFHEVFQDEFDDKKDMIENIINDIVIFEDKKILTRRLRDLYHLDEDKIKKIKGFHFKDYGRLSKKLLTGIELVNKTTGETFDSVIDLMEKTTLNLQEILYSEDYLLIHTIEEYNKNLEKNPGEDYKDFIDENLYVSPIMKRSLIQSYKIIEEVEKIIKHPIDSYYVECTRTNKEEKKRTISRYDSIKQAYKDIEKISTEFKIDLKNLSQQLDQNKDNLTSDKLYLYFTQLGKSLYTLKDIDLDSLIHTNATYDIDHIYPQSIIKDDSISNRVLVEKSKNNDEKSNKFLFELDHFLPEKAFDFYKLLLDKKLITNEKYRRLTKKELSKDELDDFVNRQIVATNQSVKGLIDLLKTYKGVDASNIVYSKAEIVSDFRNKFNLPKSRVANNYHHAHDAYLNVVCGRVVDSYFKLSNFFRFRDYYHLKDSNITTNPMRIFEYNRTINNHIIWEKDKTIEKIRKNLYERYDVLETTRAFIGTELLRKVTIKPAGSGKLYPTKEKDARKDTEKYGGFSDLSYSSFCILRSVDKKGKTQYQFVAIPKMFSARVTQYLDDSGYKNYEIIKEGFKVNSVFEIGKKKFCITGCTGEQYVIENLKDRNFRYEQIITIKKIEKYFDNEKNGRQMYFDQDYVVIAFARNKNCKEIILNDVELEQLYQEVKNMYQKDIYSYSNITKISSSLPDDLTMLNLKDKIYTLNELLKLLKTNERKIADLTKIGLSKFSGTLSCSRTLTSGTRIIAESVTGYYSKILFEVK